MKNLSIILLILLLSVSSLFSQAKPGGIARQISMGGSNVGGGYSDLVINPFIWDDPAQMFLNPAVQSMYKDYGWTNIAAADGYGYQNAGVAFSLNNEWTLGTILSYDPSSLNGFTGYISDVTNRSSQSIPRVMNVWEVIASRHSGSITYGLGVTYGWSNSDMTRGDANKYAYATHPPNDTTIATSRASEASSKMYGFRLGLVDDLGSGSLVDVSAAIRFDKGTDNKSSSPADTGLPPYTRFNGMYSLSGTEFQFNARGKFKMSDKFNFVPYGMLFIGSWEPKEDTPPLRRLSYVDSTYGLDPTTEKASVLSYTLGIGGEYRTQTFYLAGGISWRYTRYKDEYADRYTLLEYEGPGSPVYTDAYTETYTVTETALPVINVGGEWWFTDWLAGRVGYYRAIGNNRNVKDEWQDVTTTSGSGLVTTSSHSNETNFLDPTSYVYAGGYSEDNLVTLGLGFKFGGFALDATVSERALRRGLGLIGGSNGYDNAGIDTFGFMTASYNFGE